MTIDTTRPEVERLLRLAVTNRHITPAIEALALALLDRAEKAEAERDALQAEVERLRALFDGVMIGGNHLAVCLPDNFPPYGTPHGEALEIMGAGSGYEVWCCWNAIMTARTALETHK